MNKELLNTIICGDNCEVMRQMDSESIDLVVTSPPYDDLRTYGGHEWDFYGVAWNLARLLKPGGVIVWNVADATKDGNESGNSMRQALHFQSLGLNLHDTMIYAKSNPIPLTHNRYEQEWEYAFILSKGRPSSWNPIKERSTGAGKKISRRSAQEVGASTRARDETTTTKDEKQLGNIWYYTTADGDTKNHPAPYPEPFAKDHIQSWSDTGAIVLDPFAGSGTTLKAAKELNRHYIGIEINPEYVKICEDRTSQEVLNLG